MTVECSKCSYVISEEEGRLPPWCPRCAADLKRGASSGPPASVAIKVPCAAGATGASVAQELGGGTAVVCADQERPIAPSAKPDALASPPATADSGDKPEHVFAGKIIWQVVACLCALVCFGIVAIAVNQYFNPHALHRPKVATVLGLTGLFGVAGLVAVYVAIRIRGLKYVVYPDRLIETNGGKVTVIRWDQIREVFHAVHPAWQTYRVVTRKGHTFRLTGDVKQHIRLGEIIAERSAERLLPEALRELEAGRAVCLGPLRVNRAGVKCSDEMVPWHQILSLTFGLNPRAVKGSMVSNMIHVRLGSCMVEMGEIPNYRLFEKLVRHLHPTCLTQA